ncbi:transglutaminase domain-containing protein [Paracoccus sp. TK19116]|uniref:Transglutaminase domain-containing protein n=1 Tax=Paracoccus albicereus TaxID=2922394 RepID=A0ABT1MUC0_9RHOB|nr:transglutaminase domain-containing protein [Paracoccus albicereus]MCQ0971724.1 transglutaminase domain-containing protein [Paracoccus albicereus]
MPQISRRHLLLTAFAAASLPAMPGFLRRAEASPVFAPAVSDWQRYSLRTNVTLAKAGPAQVWLPVPAIDSDWQRSVDDSFTGNATEAAIVTDPETGARYLHARFDGDAQPQIELTSLVETRNRVADWEAGTEPQEDPAVLQAALQGSSLKPLDGVVLERAQEITKGAATDRDKVAAIYAWIVENCHRNLDTPGCGPGDIEATLASAGIGGKCADLNGLFVGLARASGVPARDIYGVRVAPSEFGYKQLGANSPTVTGAQHCRAEVWLTGLGWVAMDPADVLKVMRAETDTWIKDAADPLVAPVDAALFGSWEGNWVGFNTASDIKLSGGNDSLPFLMYPQGQIGSQSLDELDAEAFRYEMTATAL